MKTNSFNVPQIQKRGILDLFWDNVEWHMMKEGVSYTALVGGSAPLAKKRILNPSLKKVQQIARMLGIDDYSILFENYEG